MVWNEKRTSLETWGKAPARIEPVAGRVFLRGLETAQELVAQPLDATGEAMGPPTVLTRVGQDWSLTLGQPPATTWQVITVRR
jgi:hypothetical protein